MLSSKNESKGEERLAGRIDLLAERLDTLASTVATTASGMAKKDGEIATLRRDLQLRDEQIQALAARTQATVGADPRELNELRQTVAALANERAKQAGSKQIDQLAAKVAQLGQRLETVSTTISTTAAGLAGREGELAVIRKQLESQPAAVRATAPDPELGRKLDELGTGLVSLKMRLDGQATELEAVKTHAVEQQAPADELRAMLTTLRGRVESLDGLRAGVSEEQLDERLAETSAALDILAQRIDALTSSVETATTSLVGKEHELAALHRHFTESSKRIESIVDDLREALAAFPEAAPETLATVRAELQSTAEQIDTVGRRLDALEASPTQDHVGEVVERIELLDKRISSVSAEIARAKTLWPVALRSLEARLDDVMASRADGQETAAAHASPSPHETGADSDDLLAGLRDSLQAMESVAAELERASEPESEHESEHDSEHESEHESEREPQAVAAMDDPTEAPAAQQAMAGGARIVQLRSSDP